MTFKQFADACHSTNTYTEQAIRSGVLLSGISEETGEVLEAFCQTSQQSDDGLLPDTVMELMDVTWYIFESARSFGLSLSDIIDNAASEMVETDVRFDDHTEVSILDDELGRGYLSSEDASTCIYALIINVGKLHGNAKRMWRDDNGTWNASRIAKIQDCLSACLSCVFGAVNSLGYTVEIAFEELIKKLFSRRDRGMIHGSGSHR